MELKTQIVALILALLALPLISLGSSEEATAVWWAGLGMLVVAALIPPVARYALPGGDEENGDGDEEG